MKVRCVNNNWNNLTKGKVYDVIYIIDSEIQIYNDLGDKQTFYIGNFEVIKEENKMQEKTFREVIADIKEGEVWESAQNCFQLKEIRCVEGRVKFKLEGVFVEKTDNSNNVNTGEGLSQTFKLQRKQYSFEEAFKAYEEGKEIESCIKNFKIKKLNNKPHYIYKHMSEWDYINNNDACFSIDEIQGKWYINN